MIRLFVGLELPEEARARLSTLMSGLPGANWTPVENLHLTLRFIGEIDEDVAEEVDRELAAIDMPAFALTLAGVHFFGQAAKARHLWVGVEPSEPLIRLQAKVERACQAAGLTPEGRKFTPHVTIGKVRGVGAAKLQRFVENNNLFTHGPIPVDGLALFSSHLGHGPPIYRVEADYSLCTDS